MKNELTAERLKTALDRAHLSQQELSDRSGVSKASISQYVNGRYIPSNFSAGKMAEVLHVNPAWLMGFEVDMELSDRKTELLYVFDELPEVQQKHLIAYAKFLLKGEADK